MGFVSTCIFRAEAGDGGSYPCRLWVFSSANLDDKVGSVSLALTSPPYWNYYGEPAQVACNGGFLPGHVPLVGSVRQWRGVPAERGLWRLTCGAGNITLRGMCDLKGQL